MRMTNQRQVILQELRESCEHLTADQIYERVRTKMPRISLATVYRNLDKLAQAGIIAQLELGTRQKVFDADTTPHQHIICAECEQIDNISIPAEEQFILSQCQTDYSVTGYRIDLIGICSQCTESTIKN